MPQIADVGAIRALLASDPSWAVYARGDLAPKLFEQTTWYADTGQRALVLRYSGFEPNVLFALGPADRLEPLLEEVGFARPPYLHTSEHILPLVKTRF